MSESDLEFISKTSGVDFLALREKYKNVKHDGSEQSPVTKTTDTAPSDSNTDKLGKQPHVVDEILSRYNICKACNGLGIVKTIYNHMTMERTCEECDGDSIVMQANLDKAVASLHPIDDR
jgi:hypothetical protein